MKKYTLILTVILTGLFAFATIGCKKCKDEDPRARIINNGTQKADVQVKTLGGNTININNVAPGTSSPYSSYAAGQITFTINVANIIYIKTVDVAKCFDYDIAIDASNTITASPIDRN